MKDVSNEQCHHQVLINNNKIILTPGPVLMSLRPETKVQNPYPAPEQDAQLERLACSTASLQECYGAEKPANHSAGCATSDLSEWQEDETQWKGWRDARCGVRWCESAMYTPPATEKEVRLAWGFKSDLRFDLNELSVSFCTLAVCFSC